MDTVRYTEAIQRVFKIISSQRELVRYAGVTSSCPSTVKKYFFCMFVSREMDNVRSKEVLYAEKTQLAAI